MSFEGKRGMRTRLVCTVMDNRSTCYQNQALALSNKIFNISSIKNNNLNNKAPHKCLQMRTDVMKYCDKISF
jgi:hypothetical protein